MTVTVLSACILHCCESDFGHLCFQTFCEWFLVLIGVGALVGAGLVAKQYQSSRRQGYVVPLIITAVLTLALWVPCYQHTDRRVRYLMRTVDESGSERKSQLFTPQDMRNPIRFLCKLLVLIAMLPCTCLCSCHAAV